MCWAFGAILLSLTALHFYFGISTNSVLYVPLQVLQELHRNLVPAEVRRVFAALEVAQECWIDYTPGEPGRVQHWKQHGAKKGDAIIVAQLEASGVRFLISENRHFLSEVEGLPFEVLTSEQALHC